MCLDWDCSAVDLRSAWMTVRRLISRSVCVAVLATPLVSIAAADAADPLSRIRVDTPAGQRGHLADSTTGARFVPRGSNYVRLAEAAYVYQTTFEPGRYAPQTIDAALGAMRRDGYNSVRVFIDGGSIPDAQAGRPHGLGRGVNDLNALHAPYMENVADFLRRADAQCIRVILSLDGFPSSKHYYDIAGRVAPNIEGNNLHYLDPGHVRAKEAYLRNFVTDLRNRLGADRLSVVLAYQIDNEAFVNADKAPFNRKSGTVKTQDGQTYDMAVPAQRQQAQDSNLVEYANRMVDAIRAVDPKGLVTMGMFTYRAVGKAGPNALAVACDPTCAPGIDYRYPARPWSLSHYSKLSFLDIHTYPIDRPGDPYDLDRDLQSSEWNKVVGTTITGEFGAFKSQYKNDVVAAAYAMETLQVRGCQLGVAGWLYWTFDTTETAEQQLLFNLNDHGGAINGRLAPILRVGPVQARHATGGSCHLLADRAGHPGAPAPGTPARPRRLSAKVARTSLGRALRRGLKVTVGIPAAGRIVVTGQRGRVIAGRKRTKSSKPVARRLTLPFTRRARARWRHARRLTLTVPRRSSRGAHARSPRRRA